MTVTNYDPPSGKISPPKVPLIWSHWGWSKVHWKMALASQSCRKAFQKSWLSSFFLVKKVGCLPPVLETPFGTWTKKIKRKGDPAFQNNDLLRFQFSSAFVADKISEFALIQWQWPLWSIASHVEVKKACKGAKSLVETCQNPVLFRRLSGGNFQYIVSPFQLYMES